MSAELRVLCLNSGSSSLKLSLWALDEASKREYACANGAVEAIGSDSAALWLEDGHRQMLAERRAEFHDHAQAAAALFDAMFAAQLPAAHAIAHRIVHGGTTHCAPTLLTPRVLEDLRRAVPFAPLHLPLEIALLESASARFPGLPQVLCFDTGFHRALPALAQRLPLPRHFFEKGVRRYGFHGLSYEYVVQELGPMLGECAVIAHLGSGSSLCALYARRPIETSMGFSPTGGVMMATRSGDLDPGVLLHLLRAGYDERELLRIVQHESGLAGVSGTSGDMRALLAARADDPRADEAVTMFCRAVKQQIGAYAALLDGLDSLIFTGGIGEHSAAVRAEICDGLGHLGVELDEGANREARELISARASSCSVHVIESDENRMLARHAQTLLRAPRVATGSQAR